MIGDHSDAVWSLYNNYEGDDLVKQLMFSSSATGSLLCHKITNNLSLQNTELITSVCDYSVDSPVTCLSSNANHSSMLFGGRVDGNISVFDIETRQILSTFSPQSSIIDPVFSCVYYVICRFIRLQLTRRIHLLLSEQNTARFICLTFGTITSFRVIQAMVIVYHNWHSILGILS